MFTGLIQGKGKILTLSQQGNEARLCIRPLWAMQGYVVGESIAVNGVCLTVESFEGESFSAHASNPNATASSFSSFSANSSANTANFSRFNSHVGSFNASFTAYASGETLKHTNLGDLKSGGEVNLERALCLGDSMGGHIVSGHVDAVCRVEKITAAGDSKIYRLSCPLDQARYIVPKGSVTLDGISLTVNAAGADFFEVNIIPSTQGATTIASWVAGRKINLETDIIGKYVERMLQPFGSNPSKLGSALPQFGLGSSQSGSALPQFGGNAAQASNGGSNLDLDFFRKNGF